MAGSFSLVEKIAVAGAFCALVAMAVGTETDPGVIAAAQVEPVAGRESAPDREADTGGANFWSLAKGAHQPRSVPLAAPSPAPEVLPPDFGATPSPDLPK